MPRQRQCLDWITAFITKNRYSPSYEEIGAALGLKAKSGVHRIVVALEEQHKITRVPNRERSIEIMPRHAGTAAGIVGVLEKAFGFDDGEGVIIACSPAEAMKALRGAGF